jgi:hypothetical protein
MAEAVLKYIVVPLVAVVGVYVVGSVIYQLFGVPAIILFCAVGGVGFNSTCFRLWMAPAPVCAAVTRAARPVPPIPAGIPALP